MHRVVVGALVSEDRVLLVHRSPRKRAFPDQWDLPGGGVEDGESEMGALTRELHEELGVQIVTSSTMHLCRLTIGPAEAPVLVSAWLVHEWEGSPANVAPDEHDDIGWFGPDELPPLAHEPVRRALVSAVWGRRSQRPQRSTRSHGQSVASQRATASASGTSRSALSALTHDCAVTSHSSEDVGYR